MLMITYKGGLIMNICLFGNMKKIRPISVRISANYTFNGISASKIKYFPKLSK